MSHKSTFKCLLFLLLFLSGPIISHANVLDAIRLAKKMTQSELLSDNFDSLTFPFQIVNNWIVVEVNVESNGREVPAKFMLDSGAPTVISDKLATDNHFPQEKVAVAADIINTPDGLKSAPEHLAQNLIFKMGAYKVKKDNTLVRHLDNDYGMSCNDIDGLLGIDFLSHATLLLDFDHKTITFIHAGKFQPAAYGLSDYWKFSSYSLVQKTPYLDVKINGQKESAIIDLGYNGAVLMQFRNPKHKDARQFLNAAGKQTVETFGALATINGVSARKGTQYLQAAATLEQKKELINRFSVSFLVNEKLKEDKVNIGVGLLKNYLVAIDWQDKKMYLKQQKSIAASELPPLFHVAYFPLIQKFCVSFVSTDSKWYQNGLHAGDTVTAINGKKLENLITENNGNVCAIRQELSQLNEQIKTVMLKSKAKQERTISVE